MSLLDILFRPTCGHARTGCLVVEVRRHTGGAVGCAGLAGETRGVARQTTSRDCVGEVALVRALLVAATLEQELGRGRLAARAGRVRAHTGQAVRGADLAHPVRVVLEVAIGAGRQALVVRLQVLSQRAHCALVVSVSVALFAVGVALLAKLLILVVPSRSARLGALRPFNFVPVNASSASILRARSAIRWAIVFADIEVGVLCGRANAGVGGSCVAPAFG